ncbi:ABC transporter permease [Halobacterium litoreum]|uniref:ABC transporter permease n=1 Tax=Halobacterium litoreum TaxID=2039234 RepID=A0ABD5NH65_9EURY|nr:ABC transporter permease [Halobacterium litoreum]UHH12788.1 ABC transporter permease [Halobacterium litoreum]
MSYAAFVARRGAFAVFAAFLVVSLTFGVVASVPNPELGAELAGAERSGATPAQLDRIEAQYYAEHGGRGGLVERYVDYVAGVATLDWGQSYEFDRPVVDVVADRLPYTLAYVVPGVLLSFVLGAAFGVAGAFGRDGLLDRGSRVVAYLAMGLPAFWVVHYLDVVHPWTLPWLSPARVVISASRRVSEVWAFSHPLRYVWPSLVLSLGLVAGLLQHSRAEALEYERAQFVKLLEAKGASRLRVARHVLRNAAIPILTLSFVEVLGILMLNVYIIEGVFAIPGLGTISLFAIENQDVPLVVGTTMVLVFIGIGGNFLQDLLYGYLDPGVDER